MRLATERKPLRRLFLGHRRTTTENTLFSLTHTRTKEAKLWNEADGAVALKTRSFNVNTKSTEGLRSPWQTCKAWLSGDDGWLSHTSLLHTRSALQGWMASTRLLKDCFHYEQIKMPLLISPECKTRHAEGLFNPPNCLHFTIRYDK